MKVAEVWKSWFMPKLSDKQIREICRQLGFALGSELSLPMSLAMLSADMKPGKQKKFLMKLEERIQDGYHLAESLQLSGFRYTPVLLQFVMAGEQNGNLARAITEAENYLDRKERLRKKVISALFYPMVVFAMTMVAFLLLFVMVVPVIRQTYSSLHADLPQATQMVIALSDFLLAWWPQLVCSTLLCLFTVASVYQLLAEREGVQKWLKQLIFHIPLMGNTYRQYWFVQIGQSMGMLLESGMLPVESVQSMEEIYRKSLFRWELRRMSEQVREGSSLIQELCRSSFVPSTAAKMLSICEENGNMAQALTQLTGYYRYQLEYSLQLIASVLEPVFIVLLGAGILVIAGSLFLPMMQSYQYLLV